MSRVKTVVTDRRHYICSLALSCLFLEGDHGEQESLDLCRDWKFFLAMSQSHVDGCESEEKTRVRDGGGQHVKGLRRETKSLWLCTPLENHVLPVGP
jgi:hypothetical protein